MIDKLPFNGSTLRLDSIGAKRFIFIGIAKKSPHGLYFFEADHNFIVTGRKKYQALLRKWREYDYVPTSWGLPIAA